MSDVRVALDESMAIRVVKSDAHDPIVLLETGAGYVIGMDLASGAWAVELPPPVPGWRRRLTRRLVDELAQVAREIRELRTAIADAQLRALDPRRR